MLKELLAAGESRRDAIGEILFHRGDASDALYVVLSGRLRVYSGNANGREVVYNVLEPGDTLGELLLDGGTRSASVQAVTEAECLMINGDARRVPADLTQQGTANRIGATRGMVNHVMQRLRREGYIVRDTQWRKVIVKPLPAQA